MPTSPWRIIVQLLKNKLKAIPIKTNRVFIFT
jgi:hypothetical protein